MVFVQEGCPACHEFFPRLAKLVEPYRKRGLVDVEVVNFTHAKPKDMALGDSLRVRATPTTFLENPGAQRRMKLEGAVDDDAILGFLRKVQ